jgi:hypothetical protein
MVNVSQFLAVAQSKILLSVMSWLLREINQVTAEGHLRLLKSMTELCEVTVQRELHSSVLSPCL